MRSLPCEFEQMIRGRYGNVAERLLAALAASDPSLAVRANAAKGVSWGGGRSVPWFDSGIYLDARPCFALDPHWHQGLYYVQDASSMALTAVVRHICSNIFDNAPLRYLDACAAPGGKTIAAIDALPEGSAVLANEYEPRRAGALVENIAKHGFAAVAVSVGDTARIASLGAVFDIVAVDAPCSGEGMMRKEPEAVAQWSPALVQSCAALQREILSNCWAALKPGGVLIFSTCTFNSEENDRNFEFITDTLGAEPLDLPLGQYEGVVCDSVGGGTVYRFMPGLVEGEGLFVCAARKPGVHKPFEADSRPRNKKSDDIRRFADATLLRPEQFVTVATDGGADAVPCDHVSFFAALDKKLRLMRRGLPLCAVKGKNILPTAELVFSTEFNADAFARVELSREQALAYLHGDSLADLPDGLPKGVVTVTYDNRPLGPAKNIGRRANNLYPDALRLRLDPSKPGDDALFPPVKLF